MTEPVQSVSFGTHVIADCGISDDIIYNITRAIHDNLGDLGIAVAAISGTTEAELGQDVGIQQHPGSARFFSELK
jgi:hypothetical protein